MTVPDPEPEVAVTVIAVPAAAVPAAIVAVSVPFASVVAGLPEMVPADDENVTMAPETALLFASVACAVIVADAEPSDGIVAALVVTAMLETVLPPPGFVDGINASLPLPPHAPNASASAARTVIEANFLMSHPTLKTTRPIHAPL